MADTCRSCGGTGIGGWHAEIDPKTGKTKPETATAITCQRCGGSGQKQ